MDILLHVDILLMYFEEIFNVKKSTIGSLISSIITNETNSFIVNRIVLNEYEKRLIEHYDNNLDSIYPFLIEFLSKKIDVAIEEDSDDFYKEIENEYLSNIEYAESIIYSNISNKKTNSLNNNYSCVLEEIKKPNIHWLISQLAILESNSLSLRYFDFNDDDEIQGLFDNLFMLSSRHPIVYIYDRQINFGHNLFNSIKNSHLIHYFTTFSISDYSDNQIIKNNFKRVKIFKIRRNQIHERKIIIRDLIIEVDNDFWNLRCCEATWKIDITLCNQIASKIIRKNVDFKKIN